MHTLPLYQIITPERDMKDVERLMDADALTRLEEKTRLEALETQLCTKAEICCSAGLLSEIPQVLTSPYHSEYVGFIICQKGQLQITTLMEKANVKAGETVYFSTKTDITLKKTGKNLSYALLFYQSSIIRDIIGNSLMLMRLHAKYGVPELSVWATEKTDHLMSFIDLLTSIRTNGEHGFPEQERKLLIMSLTYRLCNIFSSRMCEDNAQDGRRTEVFTKLVKLISQHYATRRNVEFYANELCLSPKYLSTISKELCGYPLQKLIFRAITQRAIFLLTNTSMSVQEIANELHFPNASAFGTFFKKQTGCAPRQYTYEHTAGKNPATQKDENA